MQTEITELLGIQYPIIQGGMAWVAEHHLAAAVSAAGGQADGHNAAQGKSGQFSSIHNRVPPIPTAL